MPGHEAKSSRTMDETTVIDIASMLLHRAGYSGAWSRGVKEALRDRLDIVQTKDLPIERFFEPIVEMVGLRNNPVDNDGLLRRTRDTDVMLRTLKEANGELRQQLIRKCS